MSCQRRISPGNIDWGSPNFGSERSVELFCGKLLLTETTTRSSIRERRSPLAWKILLYEQRRTDHRRALGGYPKTITFCNIPEI